MGAAAVVAQQQQHSGESTVTHAVLLRCCVIMSSTLSEPVTYSVAAVRARDNFVICLGLIGSSSLSHPAEIV